MNGKENIINKILSDADEKCRRIVEAAEQSAIEIKRNADVQAANERKALETRVESVTAERIRNRVATAELDARKYKLNAKQQLIAQCYDKALKHLAELPVKDKQQFVVSLLKKYAEKGETVLIAKCDKDVVTQKLLDSVGKSLTLGKSFHNEAGGVVLQGNGYDKDLTLSRIVGYLREQTESKVAATLFGD